MKCTNPRCAEYGITCRFCVRQFFSRIHGKKLQLANNPKPYIGQFVSRELTQDTHVCYIADIKGTTTGGNGTVQYRVTVEDSKGTKSEDITITSGDTCNYETAEWQCAVCECFTMCVCDRNSG